MAYSNVIFKDILDIALLIASFMKTVGSRVGSNGTIAIRLKIENSSIHGIMRYQYKK